MVVRPRSCERAAEFVSLELDGELSLFERVMLKHHLKRCESCAVYAHDVTRLTDLLRSTPVEPIHLTLPLSHRRHRISRVLQSVAVTAAVAAGSMWVAFSLPGNARSPGHIDVLNPSSARTSAVSDDRYDWAAGLPRTENVTRLFPGGLYTSSTNF